MHSENLKLGDNLFTVTVVPKKTNLIWQERIFSFEGGGSGSHSVKASLWRRLWTCRQTEYWM